MELEKASKQVRIFESDYKWFMEQANTRRTLIGQVIHEARKAYEGKRESVQNN